MTACDQPYDGKNQHADAAAQTVEHQIGNIRSPDGKDILADFIRQTYAGKGEKFLPKGPPGKSAER